MESWKLFSPPQIALGVEDVFIKQVFPVAVFSLVVVAAPVGMWEKINKFFFSGETGRKTRREGFFFR